ncbi:calcium-binding protein [Albimonas sp. CAU 1670]|uniref:calcium-binding protein n=1 Tax=Albimonas sp. CAU 1670 TaxID=3032599 RepID=UPI0023DB67FF|nr:calcium-binding protein [Albimonas sp. CAU 1670]MDF2235563.1 calcium-binding protein [Albimonas sp. CAU 1670]
MTDFNGTAGPDDLKGEGGDDRLYGFGGDDKLWESEGVDSFYGGEGFDTYYGFIDDASLDDRGMWADLKKGKARDTTGADAFLESIEEVVGSAGSDRLLGSGAAETFSPVDGDDYVDGRGGIDQIYFWVSPFATRGTFVDLKKGVAIDPSGGRDVLKNIENVHVDVTDDKVLGDGGDNLFRDRGGDDLFNGRGGDDWICYDRGKYIDGDVSVKVWLNKGKSKDSDGDVDKLKNIESIRGTLFDDVLVGDRGDNGLNGRVGADKVKGGGGEDTFFYSWSGYSSREMGVDVILDFQDGWDTIQVDLGFESREDLEQLEIDVKKNVATVAFDAFFLKVKGDIEGLGLEDFSLF